QFSGTVLQKPLQRDLDRLKAAQLRVLVTGLEIAGTNDATAAINLETVVVTLFSHPAVDGILLGGLTAEQTLDPTAAMLKPDGSLTEVGRRFDAMFGNHWRSNLTQRTDELGNVQARVFPGRYRVETTLADGTQLQGNVYVRPGKDVTIRIIQPPDTDP
ncbi:MAG: hypothetical protein MJA84_00370, partial [Firmicutes bacterium]|nr:hypothetical protein [Bacillota bacterium]